MEQTSPVKPKRKDKTEGEWKHTYLHLSSQEQRVNVKMCRHNESKETARPCVCVCLGVRGHTLKFKVCLPSI